MDSLTIREELVTLQNELNDLIKLGTYPIPAVAVVDSIDCNNREMETFETLLEEYKGWKELKGTKYEFAINEEFVLLPFFPICAVITVGTHTFTNALYPTELAIQKRSLYDKYLQDIALAEKQRA